MFTWPEVYKLSAKVDISKIYYVNYLPKNLALFLAGFSWLGRQE